jgi:hypothetical protein
MKDNVSRSFEPRHVIPDTRISSGHCPRCDVNVTHGARDLHAVREIFKVTRNKRAVRHIHVKTSTVNELVNFLTAELMFLTDLKLVGRCGVRLAAPTPCRLQLRTLLEISANK